MQGCLYCQLDTGDGGEAESDMTEDDEATAGGSGATGAAEGSGGITTGVDEIRFVPESDDVLEQMYQVSCGSCRRRHCCNS